MFYEHLNHVCTSSYVSPVLLKEQIKARKELEEKDIDHALSQLQADKIYLAECELQYQNALAGGNAESVNYFLCTSKM